VAKVTGTQSVPSALLDLYRGALGEQTPKNAIAKRYPYRVPTIQTERGHPSAKQLEQRARFNTVRGNFETLSPSERTRWYDNMPPWGSFLWYYNYFLMSGLSGNADTKHGGAGLIKSIQFKEISMPGGTGEGQVAITAIDPTKAVVMLYGNSHIMGEYEQGVSNITVYPYVSSIAAELVKCKWSITAFEGDSTQAANIGITVIEYI